MPRGAETANLGHPHRGLDPSSTLGRHGGVLPVRRAVTDRSLDIGERAPARARRDLGEFLTTLWGLVVWGGFGAAGVLVGSVWAPESWHPAVGPFAGFVGAVAVVLGGGWIITFLWAFARQRDEARSRLREIREAAETFEVAPVEATSVPVNEDALLRILVENRGRGARFGVVLEDIDGTEEPLVDPFAPLYWMARPGVLAEEIPTGEGRLVGVAVIERQGNGFTLWPMSPTGDRYERDYPLSEGRTTLWLRLSTRGLPEVTYVRWVSVVIDWDGQPGSDPHVEVGPDRDPPEDRYVIASMAPLLEY